MPNEMYGIGGNLAPNSNSGSTAVCSSSRWLTEEVLKLIDIVQSDEAIYNPRHKYYFCRPYVENFWREVDVKMEKNPGASLAKWTNLRISFRREYTNYVDEKLSPCWSYFDRMLFLHPYLRKKHQSKSLDSQVQDALVQISSLSNRLQRERIAAAASSVAGINMHRHSSMQSNRRESVNSRYCIDSYLDYFEDEAPNNLEFKEFDDNRKQHTDCFARFNQRSLSSDIKYECEENTDEYEARVTPSHEDNAEEDDRDMAIISDGQQQHLQHLQIQRNGIHEYFHSTIKCKRIRVDGNVGCDAAIKNLSPLTDEAAQHNVNTPPETNVSFVRPTFAKHMGIVSTTSGNQAATRGNSVYDFESSTSAAVISSSINVRDQHRAEHGTALCADRTHRNSHCDICDCKTDPDVMFLMSLLPDIQKLNGRDRGKIKIAFQNTLQYFLYPE